MIIPAIHYLLLTDLKQRKLILKYTNGITLDEFYTNPGYFSEPRRVEVGLSYNF